MEQNIFSLLSQAYGISFDVENYGNGHINDTYATTTEPRYVIQRINHHVFTDPVGVMDNFETVTKFLRGKIVELGGDPDRETLNLIYTRDCQNHICIDGNYYRVYRLVENSFTYDLPETAEQFKEAGRAFGHFQRMLSDFPADELVETIPHFHDTPHRYKAFRQAVEADVCGRKKDVLKEIAFVDERVGMMSAVVDAIRDGEIPLRVTHNDTKINNVLFDSLTGKGLCVIDLDTVMPGSMLYDFGDAIRAGATTGAEDEKDLSKVNFSLEYYKAFREGFLAEMGEFATEKEIELLPLSARLLTLECGMRFLTDHLQGDTYFKVHREGHNLDRCRTQFKLVADMEAADAEMRK